MTLPKSTAIEERKKIMSSKEKAKEIIEKFTNIISKPYKLSLDEIAAKQCALIHVNEILKTFKWMRPSETLDFYEEVKSELEKL